MSKKIKNISVELVKSTDGTEVKIDNEKIGVVVDNGRKFDAIDNNGKKLQSFDDEDQAISRIIQNYHFGL